MRRYHSIFLFGESEKGEFGIPIICRNLPQCADLLGHPPEDSKGLLFAVQALLFERELVFFRVKEEGFSIDDYMRGLKILKESNPCTSLSAICMPGVGDTRIIDVSSSVCTQYKSCLIIDERDLYDYLSSEIIN